LIAITSSLNERAVKLIVADQSRGKVSDTEDGIASGTSRPPSG
jgi:hypothetical protein